jgi:acyl-CoA synthetase (AMP-forming)/AMP-acid ligase II
MEMAASGRAVPTAAGRGRRLVCSGRPVLGIELRIREADEEVPQRQVGEIQLRGESLMRGYADAQEQPFEDGWLRTGDLGYLVGSDLYVTGRLKDVMIVMGHNYYPDDFEWAAGRVEGVKAGRCVAFAEDAGAKERIVLLVEPSGSCDPDALSVAVRHAVADAVGVLPETVLVLPRGTLETTTSGKLRRSAMRDAYLRGDLTPIESAAPAL